MKTLKQFLETIKYNSDMGVMDWGTPAGTEYMKDVTPGQKNSKKTVAKFKEETEAAKTKDNYKSDNSDEAPVLGDYALTKQDISEIEHELDNMAKMKWKNMVSLMTTKMMIQTLLLTGMILTWKMLIL